MFAFHLCLSEALKNKISDKHIWYFYSCLHKYIAYNIT